MEVVIPLQYASDDEVKAEEAKLAQAAPGSSGPVAPVTATPALASPGNANQSGESAPLKVMILKDSRSSDGTTATLRIYNETTTEVIYAAPIRTDALVAYSVREATQDLAQWSSATPGQNVHDQNYSGMNNTPLTSGGSGGSQSEPMDRDNPDSGRGGAGT